MSLNKKLKDSEKSDPNVEEDGRTSSFTWLLSDAVSNTGMQGLPNIHRSKSTPRKIAWALICICGIVVMTWQITLAVMKYYEYPTSTTVEYEYKTHLEFPAITICNNNPIKMTLLENSTTAEALKQLMAGGSESQGDKNSTTAGPDGTTAPPDSRRAYSTESDITTESDIVGSGSDISGSGSDISGSGADISGSGSDISDSGSDPSNSGSDYSGSQSDSSGSGSYGNDDNHGWNWYNSYPGYDGSYYGYYGDYYYDDGFYNAETDEDVAFIENFISLASKLDRSEKIQLGHDLKTMLITCNWQGKKCSDQHFETFYNYMYGNCYTFNSGRSSGNHSKSVLKTSKIGPLYGFSMELFIEQDEYIAGLSDGAGIRLLIHNHTYMPFPEDFAISLAPGTKTSVGINRKDVYRATHPHGNCKDYNKMENSERNAFLADIENLSYTVPACTKTCFQRALIANCSCYDYRVPVNVSQEAYSGMVPGVNITGMSRCDEVMATKESCINNVTHDFKSNKLGCSELCHVPCFEVYFNSDVSYSQWPSEKSESRILNTVAKKDEYFWNILQRSSYDDVWKKQWISNNFLKVEVYFSDLNYEVVKTFASYDAIALISDLGGQSGLWLGVSIVAFFELFEVVIDSVILLSKYTMQKVNKKPKITQVNPYNEDFSSALTSSTYSVGSVCTTTSILSQGK